MCFHEISLEKIKCWEKEYPDKINEMPVQTDNLDTMRIAVRLGLPHFAARPPEIKECADTADNVQRVQSGHNKIGCKERACARVMMKFEFLRVFESFDNKEAQRQ